MNFTGVIVGMMLTTDEAARYKVYKQTTQVKRYASKTYPNYIRSGYRNEMGRNREKLGF